jgi:pimeloyl-ACP methyl ester carboxylesterase
VSNGEAYTGAWLLSSAVGGFAIYLLSLSVPIRVLSFCNAVISLRSCQSNVTVVYPVVLVVRSCCSAGRYLSAAAPGARIVMPDLLGFGRSDKPRELNA